MSVFKVNRYFRKCPCCFGLSPAFLLDQELLNLLPQLSVNPS